MGSKLVIPHEKAFDWVSAVFIFENIKKKLIIRSSGNFDVILLKGKIFANWKVELAFV